MWNILFPSSGADDATTMNIEPKSSSSSSSSSSTLSGENSKSHLVGSSSSNRRGRHNDVVEYDGIETANKKCGTRRKNDRESTQDVSTIVRNISSYLSLSDAESIGSMQSIMDINNHSTTNRYPHDHPNRKNSGDHSSYASYAPNNINHQHRQTSRGNHSNHSKFITSSKSSAAIEDNDADAAAGFGSIIAKNNVCDTGSSCNMSSDEEDERPGLTSLLVDDEEESEYAYDMYEPWKKSQPYHSAANLNNNHHKHSSKTIVYVDENCMNADSDDDISIVSDERDDTDESQVLFLASMRHERNKMLQKKLSEAVMSNPESLRTYCSSKQRKYNHKRKQRISMNQNQRKTANHPDGDSYNKLCSFCEELLVPDLLIHYEIAKNQLQNTMSGSESCNVHQCILCQNILQEKNRIPSSSSHQMTQPCIDFHHQHNYFRRFILGKVFQNIPLSILLDFSEHVLDLTIQTTISSCEVSSFSLKHLLSTLSTIIDTLWVWIVTHVNPWTLLETIQKLQTNAFNRTSEVIVTGLQSVATGVESAAAFYNFSTSTDSKYSSSTTEEYGMASKSSVGKFSSVFEKMNNMLRRETSTKDHVISEKLFDKLSKIDTTSKVISYLEREDEALTLHAKKRVQRMMHYHVSLRPFVATVILSPTPRDEGEEQLFENMDFPFEYELSSTKRIFHDRKTMKSSSSFESASRKSSDSPFMCSPKSFPPSPSSRAHVMARGSRFTEDVVFLARDHLRLEEGMSSCNEQTRVMANALREGSRLAVFNAADSGNGIVLNCGQHCATKVGNDLYCSTRGMIPVLRNRYVYFEMSVSSLPMGSERNNIFHQTSLSIGLSTLEMPLNTLVGAWKGSIGLCTTGQILSSGQWFTPPDPRNSSYGSNSTIGCLVYLDDGSAIETWDGYLVTATVVFNINGTVVESPLTTVHPIGGDGTNNPLSFDEASSISIDKQKQSTLQHNAYPLYLRKEEELFPTLTLHSTLTEVFCRFSAEDILAKSRHEIGAPHKSVVYAVDGSVLFDEKLDRSYDDYEETSSIYSSDSMSNDEDSDNDS